MTRRTDLARTATRERCGGPVGRSPTAPDVAARSTRVSGLPPFRSAGAASFDRSESPRRSALGTESWRGNDG